jgi:enoyl-CoA hydratase
MTSQSASPKDFVLVERPTESVAVLTLNRPDKLNALLPEMVDALRSAFHDLTADPDARAVVLTGAGKAFCAGVDLAALARGADFRASAGGDISPMLRFPRPLIAAINGPAVTGGLELALACDFRIASTAARFADTHSRVGLVPGWGLTARLPQAVGHGWARQMSFTGDFIDADTSLRIGLVNEVVEPHTLLPRAIELAQSIARSDAPTVMALKAIFDVHRDGTGREALALELEHTPRDHPHVTDERRFTERSAQLIRRP